MTALSVSKLKELSNELKDKECIVEGTVKGEVIQYLTPMGPSMTFYITDGACSVRVVYRGLAPLTNGSKIRIRGHVKKQSNMIIECEEIIDLNRDLTYNITNL